MRRFVSGWLVAFALLVTAHANAGAYTFRSVGTIDYDTSAGTLTPGAPAGKQVGDLLILYTVQRVSPQTVSAISGWQQLFFDNTSSSSYSVYIFARVADGTGTDTPSVVWTGTTGDMAAWIEARSGDVYTDLTTIVAHSAVDDQVTLSDLVLPNLTVTTDDTLLIALSSRVKTATSNDATTITAAGGLTKRLQHIQTGNAAMMVVSASSQQAAATNYGGADFTRDGTDENQSSFGVVLSLRTATAGPTFTAGPTSGTKTQTTVPFTYTSDTTGAVKGVACPNGQAAPTVAQVIAGNCTGGVGAVAAISDAVTATVADGASFTGLTANTTYDTHFAIDAAPDSVAISSVADQTTIAVPTFTAGPAAGTITSTTIPTTFTSSQTGDVKAVACPDGQTVPTVTQVLAGNCTGNIAAQAAFTQAVVATVGDGDTFTSLAPSTTYDTHFAQTNAAGNSAAISTLANQTTSAGGGGAFTVNPTVTAQTDVAYTIGGTTGSAVTVSAVACAKDATAPTIAQVVVADCTGGVNAIAAVSETWNGADSFVLGGALSFPVHDVYVTDGTTLITRADEFLDEPTGRQYVTKSGAPGGGEEGLLDDASPAAVNGDIMDVSEMSDSFAEGASAHAITVNVNTTFVIDAGGDTSRQLLTRRFYDISIAAWSDASPVDYAVNNGDPIYQNVDAFLFERNVSSDVGVNELFSDPEADTLVLSFTNQPAGGATDGTTWDTSFSTFGVYATVIPRATDPYGHFDEHTVTVTVGVRLPDVTGWLLEESLWHTENIFAANDSYFLQAVSWK